MRHTPSIALALILAAPATLSAQDPPAKAASFDDVLKMVADKKMPGEILETCDTIFTFNPEQVEKLTKAGASPALIDGLQRKRMKLDDVVNVVVILDCSGSMIDKMPDGRTKMEGAKAVVSALVEKIPAGRNFCLIVYGHDARRACEAVQVVRPLGPLSPADRSAVKQFIAQLKPTGHTPIARSLRAAGEALSNAEGLCQVVLITDGEETCGGKPAEEARALALRKDVRAVEVIPFDVKPEEKAAVVAIANEGRARCYDVKDEKDLAIALRKTVPGVPELAPDAPEEGFTRLFNGKDLDGWQAEGGDPRVWTADKGDLVFTTRGDASRNWLFTRKEYADFVLRLDFQLTKGANSGLAFRNKPGDPSPYYPHIQILDDRNPGAAEQNHPERQTGALHDLAAGRPAELRPTGEWNSMEVRVEGRVVTVMVNGRQTIAANLDRFADQAAKHPGLSRSAGRIGLENWFGSVRFRNIRIKELVAEAPAKKKALPADLPPAVRNLIEALSDEDAGVRATAATALGRFKEPAAVEALCDALKDKDGKVRRAAADSLGKNGEKSDAAADALSRRVADEVWVTQPIGTTNYPPGDFPPFDGIKEGWGSKDHALAALKKIAPDKVVPALAQALKAKTPEVRRWAAEGLGSQKGEAAVAALAAALTDSDGRVRRRAADALARIGDKSDVAVEALVKRVGDNTWDPRPKERVEYPEDDPPAYDDVKDWGSKHHALQALRKLAPDRAEEALTLALRAKDPGVRKWAANELAQEKGKDP
jgi:HEAT repeat protein